MTPDEDSPDDEVPIAKQAKKRKANRKKGALKVAEDTESSSGDEQDPKRACVMEEDGNSELEEEKINESDDDELDVEPFEYKGKDYLIDGRQCTM